MRFCVRKRTEAAAQSANNDSSLVLPDALSGHLFF
jgi:hypothetical protein